MVLVQVYAVYQARTIYNINLPSGLYQFRLLDFLYSDSGSTKTGVQVLSDTWRIPYGNVSRGNSLLLPNRSENGRVSSMATFNFLAEIRNGQMDMTLVGVSDAQFNFCIISFDVQYATSSDNFFPLI